MATVFGLSATIVVLGVVATALGATHSVVAYPTALAVIPAALTGGWLWAASKS
ncbi:MAG: hypothetical protein OXF79_08405 [Chloroflexi bacterium]|nr:hypothetical protein [Chloroflexota bacterium]